MPVDTEEKSITAQAADSPVVKRKHRSGPKPKDYYAKPVQEIINLSAPHAARILQEFIERRRGSRKINSALQRACEFIIDHAIGKARQKIEHSGGILTYAELSKSADNLDEKPRDILADIEELANKTATLLPEDGDKPAASGPDGGPGDDVSGPKKSLTFD